MNSAVIPLRVWLGTGGSWHLRQTAKSFQHRNALAGLWISDKNSTGLAPDLYKRCWPFHLGMKPFYHLAPQIWQEKMFYGLFPVWKAWLHQEKFPDCNVIQAPMGFATEPFDEAERKGALKVIDCPNSHPSTYYGYWQRECDLWCPGERVPVPRWMFARMNRELERADLVLCPSVFVRESMVSNGIPAAKCFTNPFGVDISTFEPRSSLSEKARFIVVGTICLRKGHQYLFRAFELVKKILPQAELVVVGDYKCDFRKERPRWEGTFVHHPHLSHDKLAALLKTCTAFVFPSQEEGFARVISEAMAAGLPIIASYESGATTLVQDGHEGFIVNSREPRLIAEAMVRVARDPDMNRKMGEASRAKGGAANTWQDYGDRLLAEYGRRLGTRG